MRHSETRFAHPDPELLHGRHIPKPLEQDLSRSYSHLFSVLAGLRNHLYIVGDSNSLFQEYTGLVDQLATVRAEV